MANVPIAHRFGKWFGWYDSSPVNRTQKEVRDGKSKRLQLGTGPSPFSQLVDSTSLSPNPHLRMGQLDDMAESETVFPIIELYVEEATQPDIVNDNKVLWYECEDAKLEKELNDLLERIDTDDNLSKIVSSIARNGNKFIRVLYNESGICDFVEVEGRVDRVYHPTTKQLIGYLWEGQRPDIPFYKDYPDLFAPWDFIHFRRLHRSNSEYGTGMLEHLYRTWKRLELGTDQMTLYRLHTMPNRFAVWVDTGDQDITTQAETMHMQREMLRSQIHLNTQEKSLHARYEAPALDSILFFAKRQGEDPKVELMQGDRDVPDVHDLELLSKMLYGGARVPKAYLGLGDDSSSGLAQSSLVTQDIRFARMIRTLRKPVISGYLQLAKFHLIFSGRNPDNYEISVKMSRISSVEEEINSEILDKQINTVSSLCGLLQSLNIPNKDIIEFALTDYLKLPREFVRIAALASELNAAAMGGGPEGGGGGMGGFGGGPPMGGGGGGDLGAFGDDDFDIPEPQEGAGSDAPGVAADVQEEATLLGKRAVITETAFRKRRKTLIESVRQASSNFTLRHKKALTKSMSKALSELHEIHRSGKVSLVEAFKKVDGFNGNERRAIFESARQFKSNQSFEGKATLLIESIGETDRIKAEYDEEHEAVKMVRNTRKKNKQ